MPEAVGKRQQGCVYKGLSGLPGSGIMSCSSSVPRQSLSTPTQEKRDPGVCCPGWWCFGLVLRPLFSTSLSPLPTRGSEHLHPAFSGGQTEAGRGSVSRRPTEKGSGLDLNSGCELP